MILINIDFNSIPIWALAIGLILICSFIAISLITGREVTFWPPKIGQKISKPSDQNMSSENRSKAATMKSFDSWGIDDVPIDENVEKFWLGTWKAKWFK